MSDQCSGGSINMTARYTLWQSRK